MKKGFTLIELMIVVAIIAIIAAIAIPNLMQSKLQANETAAIGAIKTINTEQTKFKTGNHSVRTTALAMQSANPNMYAHNLINLWGTDIEDENGNLVKLNLISEALAKATTEDTSYKGYVFGLIAADKNSFEIVATPAVYSKTGIKTFYLNQEGTVYSQDVGQALWDALKTALEGADPTVADGSTTGVIDTSAVGITWPSEDAAGWVVE